MLMLDYRAVSWWYWLLTVCLLTYGVSGRQEGFLFAIGITLLQVVHFSMRERSMFAFPVQVRLAYLLLLLVALPKNLQWLYWLPMIGTWAQVLFGYCAMARTVSLLPWNRREAFTLGLVRRTFISPPVRRSILTSGSNRT